MKATGGPFREERPCEFLEGLHQQGEIGCRVLRDDFFLERGSAGQGGRGDSDLPPMPPWTPYTPFKRPRDTPGPPLPRKGYVLLSLDRQGPYRAHHLVWPGARSQSGAGAGTHLAWPRCRGEYCGKVVLPWRPHADTPRIDRRRGAGGGISCAEGDSGPPRDGREPSWARPCEASGALLLSNGGTGGGHAACTLWPPPAPFGYFPARGKYLVRPQADETSPQRQALTPTKAPSSPNFSKQKPCPPHQGARPRKQTQGNCNINPPEIR